MGAGGAAGIAQTPGMAPAFATAAYGTNAPPFRSPGVDMTGGARRGIGGGGTGLTGGAGAPLGAIDFSYFPEWEVDMEAEMAGAMEVAAAVAAKGEPGQSAITAAESDDEEPTPPLVSDSDSGSDDSDDGAGRGGEAGGATATRGGKPLVERGAIGKAAAGVGPGNGVAEGQGARNDKKRGEGGQGAAGAKKGGVRPGAGPGVGPGAGAGVGTRAGAGTHAGAGAGTTVAATPLAGTAATVVPAKGAGGGGAAAAAAAGAGQTWERFGDEDVKGDIDYCHVETWIKQVASREVVASRAQVKRYLRGRIDEGAYGVPFSPPPPPTWYSVSSSFWRTVWPINSK